MSHFGAIRALCVTIMAPHQFYEVACSTDSVARQSDKAPIRESRIKKYMKRIHIMLHDTLAKHTKNAKLTLAYKYIFEWNVRKHR